MKHISHTSLKVAKIVFYSFIFSSCSINAQTPSIESTSLGCPGNYGVTIRGRDFASDASVDAKVSGSYGDNVEVFSGTKLQRSVENGKNVLRFTISNPSTRSKLSTSGLWFWVVNNNAAKWNGPSASVLRTASAPIISSGGVTGSDGYIITLLGKNFSEDASIDIRSTSNGSVIASFGGAQLSRTCVEDQTQLNFYISDNSLRNHLNTTGLYFWVVNSQEGNWSSPFKVTRTGYATPPSGSISSNSPCALGSGQSTCSVNVTWASSNSPYTCVWALNPTQLWACAGSSTQIWPYATTTSRTMQLVSHKNQPYTASDYSSGEKLAAIDVYAKIAPAGTISSNSPCTIAQGQSSCAVNISWSSLNSPYTCIWALNPLTLWTCGTSGTRAWLNTTTTSRTLQLVSHASNPSGTQIDYSNGRVLASTDVYASSPLTGGSIYLSLPSDTVVSTNVPLLATEVNFLSSRHIYLQTDGHAIPGSATRSVSAYIALDGKRISNNAKIVWKNPSFSNFVSYAKNIQTFNAIAHAEIPAGKHQVSLVVESDGGATFGAGTNLSILLTNNSISSATSTSDSPLINFDTTSQAIAPCQDGSSIMYLPSCALKDHPYATVVSTAFYQNKITPVVVLATGTGRQYISGDAYTFLLMDNAETNYFFSTPATNDLWTMPSSGFTYQAIFPVHAFYPNLPIGRHTASYAASEFFWTSQKTDNPAQYYIDKDAKIVVFKDGIVGAAVDNAFVASKPAEPYVCVTNTDQVLAQGTINIPLGHNGSVLFTGKTYVLGGSANSAVYKMSGTHELYLVVDGLRVGSTGKGSCGPQAGGGDCVSGRTISTSYLSAGAQSLAPGNHSVALIGKFTPASDYPDLSSVCTGRVGEQYMIKALPLVWID